MNFDTVKILRASFACLLLALAVDPVQAQQKPVPLGKGSYADTPPLSDGKLANEYNKIPFIHPSQEGRPVPTNDWWTDLIMHGPGGRLWANPMLVRFDDYGVAISYPTAWDTARKEKGSGVQTSTALEVRLADAPANIPKPKKGETPADGLKTSVLNWTDWTVVVRQEKANNHWDVTFGHGLPFVWIECAGFQPSLRGKGLQVQSLGGMAQSAGPADAFILKVDGQAYGIFGPAGMSITPSSDSVLIKFPDPAKGWIAVGGLPDPTLAPLLKKAAGAIPRDSIYSWKYDPLKGTVITTFELKTEALRKDAGQPLMGWIPHHFRTVSSTIKKVGTPYVTPRGPLYLAEGSVFNLEYAMPGILPFYPVPKAVSTEANPFDPARMSGYLKGLDELRSGKEPAGDTYFGGKDVMKVAQYASIAERMKDPSTKGLEDKLQKYLEDWFTYSGPGDTHYFAYYPKWKGLVGIKSSFGSEFFTDHHFHYGYFTQSAALMETMRPGFLRDYGPMARLVAKEYANWDRTDKQFPFLRTFDPWNGHSYAGGSSSGDGNNQESTSEAMNAWGGLFLLGTEMNDHEMLACGAMGWAVEQEAIRSYWNNYYAWKGDKENSSWQPAYGRPLISILGDSGGAWATFFSGASHHIMGIQWLPISPSLYYLGRDPKFVRYQFDECLKWMAADSKPSTMLSIGQDWANVLQGYLLFGEPAAVCQQMDDPANSPFTAGENAGLAYFMAHGGVQIGTPAWDAHTSIPTSTVFRNGNNLTAVIWNPDTKPAQAQIIQDGKPVKAVTVAPRSLEAFPAR